MRWDRHGQKHRQLLSIRPNLFGCRQSFLKVFFMDSVHAVTFCSSINEINNILFVGKDILSHVVSKKQ